MKYKKNENTYNSKIKRNRRLDVKELVTLVCVFLILCIGLSLDYFNIGIIKISPERFNGICNTFVSIQASVSLVGFSLISILTSFHEKEMFGMPVVRYLVKYRYRILNQKGVLFFDLILLIISAACLLGEYINTIFICFILSVYLTWHLAGELFLLFKKVELENEMFSFIKNNLMCSKLNLFNDYLYKEKMHLKKGDYNGRKPDSRLEETWLFEIDTLPLDSEEYERIHNGFTKLVNEYLSYNDDIVKAYGLDIALTIIKKYSSIKTEVVKTDEFGRQIVDISVKYAKDCFNNWMVSLCQMIYSSSGEYWKKIRQLVTEISSLEKERDIHDNYTQVNSFFDVLIDMAGDDSVNIHYFEDILHIFRLGMSKYQDNTTREAHVGYAVHFFLKTIKRGYIQIVDKEMSYHGIRWKPETTEEKLLFGAIICYIYYLEYDAEEYEIDHFSHFLIKKEDIRTVLKNFGSIVDDFFYNLTLTPDYINEIKLFLMPYELLVPNSGGKIMSIHYVVEISLLLFKTIFGFALDYSWLRKLLEKDWYGIYSMIVDNKHTKERYNDLCLIIKGRSEDERYEKLEEEVKKLSYSAVLSSDQSIKRKDELDLIRYLKQSLENYVSALSFGEIKKGNEKEVTREYIYRDFPYDKELNWNYYLEYSQKDILYDLFETIKGKLPKQVITSYDEAVDYYSKSGEYDYRVGNTFVPIYDSDYKLKRDIQKTVSDKNDLSIYDNNRPYIINAHKDKLGVDIKILDVIVRKLTPDEKRKENSTGDGKYQEQMVNDIYFEFDEEDYFKYMDNTYRMLEIKYSVKVSAAKDSGICYIFENSMR